MDFSVTLDFRLGASAPIYEFHTRYTMNRPRSPSSPATRHTTAITYSPLDSSQQDSLQNDHESLAILQRAWPLAAPLIPYRPLSETKEEDSHGDRNAGSNDVLTPTSDDLCAMSLGNLYAHSVAAALEAWDGECRFSDHLLEGKVGVWSVDGIDGRLGNEAKEIGQSVVELFERLGSVDAGKECGGFREQEEKGPKERNGKTHGKAERIVGDRWTSEDEGGTLKTVVGKVDGRRDRESRGKAIKLDAMGATETALERHGHAKEAAVVKAQSCSWAQDSDLFQEAAEHTDPKRDHSDDSDWDMMD